MRQREPCLCLCKFTRTQRTDRLVRPQVGRAIRRSVFKKCSAELLREWASQAGGGRGIEGMPVRDDIYIYYISRWIHIPNLRRRPWTLLAPT